MSAFSHEYFLRVYGYDPVKWAKRWGLEPMSHPCECGRMQSTTIPFFCGQLRGLISPRCKCGANPMYCVVRDPRFGDILSGV